MIARFQAADRRFGQSKGQMANRPVAITRFRITFSSRSFWLFQTVFDLIVSTHCMTKDISGVP
jgi:hypothetical protein